MFFFEAKTVSGTAGTSSSTTSIFFYFDLFEFEARETERFRGFRNEREHLEERERESGERKGEKRPKTKGVSSRARAVFFLKEKIKILFTRLDLVPPRRELRRDRVHHEQVAPARNQGNGQDFQLRAHAALPGRGGGEERERGNVLGRGGAAGGGGGRAAVAALPRRKGLLLLLLLLLLQALSFPGLRGRRRTRRGSRSGLPRSGDGEGRGGGGGGRQSQGKKEKENSAARHDFENLVRNFFNSKLFSASYTYLIKKKKKGFDARGREARTIERSNDNKSAGRMDKR